MFIKVFWEHEAWLHVEFHWLFWVCEAFFATIALQLKQCFSSSLSPTNCASYWWRSDGALFIVHRRRYIFTFLHDLHVNKSCPDSVIVYTVKTKVQMTTIKVNFSVIIRTIRYKLTGKRNTQVDLCMPSRYKEVGRFGVKETVLSPVLEQAPAVQRLGIALSCIG